MEIFLTSDVFIKNETSQAIALPEIIRIFEEYFNVDLGEKNRKRSVCYARGLFFAVSRDMGFLLTEISASINYGDHTAVMYWKKKINEMYNKHYYVKRDYRNLIDIIESRMN